MLSQCFAGEGNADKIAEMGHPYPRKLEPIVVLGFKKQYMVFELYAHMDWEGKQSNGLSF